MAKKALVKNGFLRATASSSVHAFVEQSEREGHVIRSTESVCTAMSGASAGVGATSASSFAMQTLSEGDPWKIEMPTVKVRCHRYPFPNAIG
jgi:hypothetical protein